MKRASSRADGRQGRFSLGAAPTSRKECTVVKAYTRAYDDPIVLKAGDRVQITRRDLWDDRYVWLWCIAGAGKQGWVPEPYLDHDGQRGTCLRDYSAWELSAAAGDRVTLMDEESGWCWVEAASGEQGWIPASCLGHAAG